MDLVWRSWAKLMELCLSELLCGLRPLAVTYLEVETHVPLPPQTRDLDAIPPAIHCDHLNKSKAMSKLALMSGKLLFLRGVNPSPQRLKFCRHKHSCAQCYVKGRRSPTNIATTAHRALSRWHNAAI